MPMYVAGLGDQFTGQNAHPRPTSYHQSSADRLAGPGNRFKTPELTRKCCPIFSGLLFHTAAAILWSEKGGILALMEFHSFLIKGLFQ